MILLSMLLAVLTRSFLDVTSLFNFAAGLVAFFFVIVCILIFLFLYDNLRRGQRKTTATATTP